MYTFSRVGVSYFAIVVMEGRCVVETWTEFGFFVGQSCTAKVKSGLGTEVFLCTGSDEVYVFNTQERNLTASIKHANQTS